MFNVFWTKMCWFISSLFVISDIHYCLISDCDEMLLLSWCPDPRPLWPGLGGWRWVVTSVMEPRGAGPGVTGAQSASLASPAITRGVMPIYCQTSEREGHNVKNIENSVSSDNIMRSQKKINFNNCLSTNVKIMAALVLLFILYI